jgi:hypothetical protein
MKKPNAKRNAKRKEYERKWYRIPANREKVRDYNRGYYLRCTKQRRAEARNKRMADAAETALIRSEVT